MAPVQNYAPLVQKLEELLSIVRIAKLNQAHAATDLEAGVLRRLENLKKLSVGSTDTRHQLVSATF